MAGIAFNNASLGYVHAMAHQLGGYHNLPHGVCNAVLLPYVMKFNLIGNMTRFKEIALNIGVRGSNKSCSAAATKEQIMEIFRQAYEGE